MSSNHPPLDAQSNQPLEHQPARRFLFSLNHPTKKRPLTQREMWILKSMSLRKETDWKSDWDNAVYEAEAHFPEEGNVATCLDDAFKSQVECFKLLRSKEIADAEQLSRGSAQDQYLTDEEQNRRLKPQYKQIAETSDGKPVYSLEEEVPVPYIPPVYAPDICMIHFNGLNHHPADVLKEKLESTPGVSNVHFVTPIQHQGTKSHDFSPRPTGLGPAARARYLGRLTDALTEGLEEVPEMRKRWPVTR